MLSEYFKRQLERLSDKGLNIYPVDSLDINKVYTYKAKHNHSVVYRLSASDIGLCIRYLFYKILKVKANHTKILGESDINLFARVGTYIHEQILNSEEYIFTEVPFKLMLHGFEIHGRIDGITKDFGLVEIKTIDNIYNKKIPYRKDLYQVMLYSYAINTGNLDQIKNIKYAKLLYISRDKFKTKEFVYNTDEIKKYSVIINAKLIKLKKAIEDNMLISITDEFIDTSQCKMCEYNLVCKR